MSSNERLLVANALDKILIDSYSEDDFAIISKAKKGSLSYLSEKLWLCLSVLETGIITIDSRKELHSPFSKDRIKNNKVLFEKTFNFIKEIGIKPYYPKDNQLLRASGHTLREAAIRGASKTLSLALVTKRESPELLARLIISVASVRELDDPELINVFDILLFFNANVSFRQNTMMKNIDATLGGTSLLFQENIKDSDVLSLIDSKYYQFFKMLTKHKISYVTPLTLKYHLLVTDKTPIDYLMVCQDEERATALTLMGS